MSGTDIFLSYARADRGTARTFAQCLAEEGFSVWWDASLHSGETFDEVIEQRLRDAKAVVVLWSPRSVASRWVRAEATLADRRNKLVPAIIEACDRPIVFELTHTAELAGWQGDRSNVEWRSFVDDLDRLIRAPEGHGARGMPEPVPAPPPPSRQPLRPGNDQIISADRYRREREPAQAEFEAVPPAEVHCLEILEGELPEATIVVESSSMKLGRSPPAAIVVPHRSVSREHCIVGLANDELLVTDLNSTNGTYIDGERISRATILPVGSVLGVGHVSLRHAVRPNSEVGEDQPPAARIAATH